MLFAIGLISQFTIGGLSGVMHASPPVDSQHNDSYFVVAHFHYVLFGGSIFGLLGATYYWFPKMTGRMMDERLGKLNFLATFIGFNMTFFPMHFLGLAGMPRRYYSYGGDSGWEMWNVIVSVGAFFLGASILLFVYNMGKSLRSGEIAGPNPWDAATLEWAVPSPPPDYNFATLPTISHRDPLWWEKYGGHESHEAEQSVDVRLAGMRVGQMQTPDESPAAQAQTRTGGHVATALQPELTTAINTAPGRLPTAAELNIHMPNPSIFPLIASVGFFIAAIGLLFIDSSWNISLTIGLLSLPFLCIAGLLVMVAGVFGWAFEPAG
jgi:cytochrome c oxidase subunit 1